MAALCLTVAGCTEPVAKSPAKLPDEKSAKANAEPEAKSTQTADNEKSAGAEAAPAAPDGVAEPEKAAAPAQLEEPRGPVPYDDPDAASLTMPVVSLTDGHAATCRLKVGDTFPELNLSDLSVKPQSLSELRGKKLTVVLIWNAAKPTALEALGDLEHDVHKRFGANGVAVLGINTGDEPPAAIEAVKQRGAEYLNLSDRDGQAFAEVATGKLPRIYLLDSSRRILWFDIEYSRTTRRDLTQAIRYALSHPN